MPFREVNCYLTTVIHLSLESYHNIGLKSEDIKPIIENLHNRCSPHVHGRGCGYPCRPGGINSNWKIEVSTTNPRKIEAILGDIEIALEMEVEKRGLAGNSSFRPKYFVLD